ncbi:Uncharacterized protein OBRU01_26460, partial [Operophtera brumata]
ANGYARSEAIVVVFLQKAKDSRRASHTQLVTFRNCYLASSTKSAPSYHPPWSSLRLMEQRCKFEELNSTLSYTKSIRKGL